MHRFVVQSTHDGMTFRGCVLLCKSRREGNRVGTPPGIDLLTKQILRTCTLILQALETSIVPKGNP